MKVKVPNLVGTSLLEKMTIQNIANTFIHNPQNITLNFISDIIQRSKIAIFLNETTDFEKTNKKHSDRSRFVRKQH